MNTHEQIMAHYETYLSEPLTPFETKGVKAASTRARKSIR